MTRTWHRDDEPDRPSVSFAGYFLAVLRGLIIIAVLIAGLLTLLFLRLFERPIFGQRRPFTPFVTQGVCRLSLWVLGIRLNVKGAAMTQSGALVANHSSWVDVIALNAACRIYFVSKAEVADWPGVGWLARATGTVFIRRDRRDAKIQSQHFESRLKVGQRLLFFPEGTSTDGSLVLPFKSTLFAAFFAPELQADMWIQPIRVKYQSPHGQDGRFYGWWGDMDFASHALKILATPARGSIHIRYLVPMKVTDYADRKLLAQACETAIRSSDG